MRKTGESFSISMPFINNLLFLAHQIKIPFILKIVLNFGLAYFQSYPERSLLLQ